MNALILASCLACGQVGDETPLLDLLEKDYQAMLKAEPRPQPVRAAAQHLLETNRNTHWTSYFSALEKLRRSRSRAAVPLILKYMMLHQDGRGDQNSYATALTILTGEDVGARIKALQNPMVPYPQALETFIRGWWLNQKEKVATDLGTMSREQLDLVAERLLAQVRSRDHEFGRDKLSATTLHRKLAEVMRSDSRHERAVWWEEELHPALVPSLLAITGYVDPKAKNPPAARETFPIAFAALPLLASLYANGEAPELANVVADGKQNSATRLACALAMHAAGEDLRTDAVLRLLDQAKKLDRRIVLLLALQYSRKDQGVSQVLLKQLDDPNEHIRAAAVFGLQSFPSKEAVPKLRKILEEQHPAQAVHTALNILANINHPSSIQALADHLQRELDNPSKRSGIYYVLSAFETATGQRWIEAGAHDDEFYRAKATLALAWWRTKQSKSNK